MEPSLAHLKKSKYKINLQSKYSKKLKVKEKLINSKGNGFYER